MRYVAATVLALAIVGTPVAAAEPDPSRLALRQADVPSGFRVDARHTGIRTNSSQIGQYPQARDLFARSGRTTGYEIQFDKGDLMIGARVDVFRTKTGARIFFDWYVSEVRKAGVKGLVRTRVRIGAGGWLYQSPHTAVFALVLWRHDRVSSGVVATGLSSQRAVALARLQQRRIAAGLR